MSAPTPHQLLLAMSKLRLNPAQVAVLAYLAAFTVPAPRSEILEHWVVGASSRTIANETGLSHHAVLHALWGDKRAGRDGQRGLVELCVVDCWSRGGGSGEGTFSVNGNFEEWAVEWRPTTRAKRPATLREVLFELRSAGLVAPWGSTRPQFFVAPQGATRANGRKGKTHAWWPIIRRKGKIGFVAPQGATLVDGGVLPWGATPAEAHPACAPSSWETSSPASRASSSSGPQQPRETPPAAAQLLAELSSLTRRKLFGDPVDEVVQAVCDNNVGDVGFVIAELRRHRDSFGPSRWKAAVELAVQLLAAGPPQSAPSRPDCELCHGSTWVDDEAGVVPCPQCRPGAA